MYSHFPWKLSSHSGEGQKSQNIGHVNADDQGLMFSICQVLLKASGLRSFGCFLISYVVMVVVRGAYRCPPVACCRSCLLWGKVYGEWVNCLKKIASQRRSRFLEIFKFCKIGLGKIEGWRQNIFFSDYLRNTWGAYFERFCVALLVKSFNAQWDGA